VSRGTIAAVGRYRFAFSLAAFTAGVALALAALAHPATSASPASRGGTLRLDFPADLPALDPTIAYAGPSWQLLAAVCANLYGYRDVEGRAGTRPVPHVAAGFPSVTRGGKRVVIALRKDYARFSSGAPVTAASYANAIQRALDPKMQSPAGQYLAEIVGAKAVMAGKAERADGVQARANRLTLLLEKPVADLVARLTMPFFCPQPGANGLPRDPEGVGAPIDGAGPYVLREWTARRFALLERNPFWRGAIAKTRPANVDRIEYSLGVALSATKLRVDRNQTDHGLVGIPAPAYGEVAQQFGINRGRFFVRKAMTTWFFAFNHDRPLFGPRGTGAGNVALKRAVNFAIDRPALARQFGFLAGSRTDQLLPPAMPGFRNWQIYPIRGRDLERARRLAAGNTRGGKAVLYAFSVGQLPEIAEVFRHQVRDIGLDVEVQTFLPQVMVEKIGRRGEPYDIALIGFAADYADPNAFITGLLSSDNIADEHGLNFAFYSSRRFDRLLKEAAALTGERRYAAFANLERVTMREDAPVAAFLNENSRFYVSESLGCFTTQFGGLNLVAVCKM
jgi:ABC-type oligopeptide transport system substrate-binding subunit